MTKNEMVKSLIDGATVKGCEVVKVYGVGCGVGYDLDVAVVLQGHRIVLKAHAGRQGWAYPEHLRPNNPSYKYTGSNDVYQFDVISYWKDTPEDALNEYFSNMKKYELQAFIDEMNGLLLEYDSKYTRL